MTEPNIVDLRTRSLEELEPTVSPVQGNSYLQSEMRRLRQVPLRQLRLEDMRLLIGQGTGLRFVVPMAIEHVEMHPLASGDFYPGDLLRQVMDVDEEYWNEHRELRSRLIMALERALARMTRVQTPTELEGEFKAGLNRHRAAERARTE